MSAGAGRDRPDLRARNALRRHFAGDREAATRALELWCGVHRSIAEYVQLEIEEESGVLPEWLAQFVDWQAIADLWLEEGRLWTLPDRKTGAVHVFLCD